MSVKLDSLIEKIKADGVDAAKIEADKVLSEAKKKADSIVKKAEDKAEDFRKASEADAAAYQKNSEAAIQQAARDTVLVLKEKVATMFDNAFVAGIDEKLDADFTRELIVKLVETWAKGDDVQVLTNEIDADKLLAEVRKSLKTGIKDSVDIKLDKKVSKGFRIGKKDGNLFYDFTDESILESLRLFLNPKIAELLKS